MQAKQAVKLFDGTLDRKSKPGELTHIDLWANMTLHLFTEISIISYSWMMLQDMSQFTS